MSGSSRSRRRAWSARSAVAVALLIAMSAAPASAIARVATPLPAVAFGLLPPIAINDSTTAVHGQQRTVAAPGVLGNDLQLGGGYTAVLVSGVSDGTLTLDANGGYRYTSFPDFTGTDSFRYKVNGGLLGISNTATVTITVTNAAPSAKNDGYTAMAGVQRSVAAPGVLANDSDADGDAFSASLVSGPANGSLSLSADGSFRYTGNAGFSGVDTFRYRATDGIASSNTATVQITVTAPTPPPTAAPTPTPTPTPAPTPTQAPTPTPIPVLPSILPSLPPLPTASVPPLPGASTPPPGAIPSPTPGATTGPSLTPTPGANSTPAPTSDGGAAGGGTGTGGSGGSGSGGGTRSGGEPVDAGPFDVGSSGASGFGPIVVDVDAVRIAFDGIEWAVPTAALSVSFLFLAFAIISQGGIGLLWVPLSRRWLGGDRRRRRTYVTVG